MTSHHAEHAETREDAALSLLLENHRSFLSYLERKLGDRALAEDVLQEAFVRTSGKLADVPDEALVPWFYRTLRNAVIDHWRRQGSASRALDAFAREVQEAVAPPPDLAQEICACVTRLASSLKPEYAEALASVDVGGTAVKDYASSHGLTATNASVRLHRARKALKERVIQSCGVCAEHGCVNCTCGKPR